MPRNLLVLLLSLTASGSLAACGSSNTDQNSAGAPKRSEMIVFANCMRSHGVTNFPDPSSNGRGGLLIQRSDRSGSGQSTRINGVPVNGPAFQTAMQTCRRYLPNGGHPTAAQSARMKAQGLAMSRCMRSHGVPNFPDPQFGSGGGMELHLNAGNGIDPNSPAFKSAQQACGSLFGKAPGPATASAP